MARAPLGMIIMLVDPVSPGARMNRMLITSSGAAASRMFCR